MAKLDKGRLSGIDGMRRHTAEELYAYARDLDAQIDDPLNRDDPRWLRDWADRIRHLADEKIAAREHKQRKADVVPGKPISEPERTSLQCCFCGNDIRHESLQELELKLEDGGTQSLWSHKDCLRSALHSSVPTLL